MTMTSLRVAALPLALALATAIFAGPALAQKPTGGPAPGAQQQPQQRPQAPQQPQQQEESDEPLRLEPLPTGAELDAFVQRAIRPALEGMRSFQRVPNAAGVYQVQTTDQALPSFFVNLVEEGNIIAPDQAVQHFQRGFGNCRGTQPGQRFEEGGLIIQNFTATCRTQSGNDVFLYIMAGHDDQRTQVLTFMTDPANADALRTRAELVFEAIISGG
jgi:hypothetical protein